MAEMELEETFFKGRFDAAVARLEEYLKQPGYSPPRKLTARQIKSYPGRKAKEGWEIYPFKDEKGYALRVFVDEEFPFSVPRAALFPAPPILKYPHIEEDGYLRIDSTAAPTDENAVVDSNPLF